MEVVVRPLTRPEEFHEAVEVQASAWRMGSDLREAVPAHMLKAIADNGGLVLGAFVEGKLVGICFGFPAYSAEHGRYFYSHMTGVREEHKYRGVGRLLKLEQRRWALEHGFELIVWTYDPCQGLNSYFNIVKLGVVARKFYINYYGELRDGINRGMPTDRVKAEWWIKSPRVEARIKGEDEPAYTNEMLGDEQLYMLKAEERGGLLHPVLATDRAAKLGDVALVEIPLDIGSLLEKDRELALKWRLSLREAFQELMTKRGFIAVDFARLKDKGSGVYVLAKARLEDVLNRNYWWKG